jgi:outer membrane usher protein
MLHAADQRARLDLRVNDAKKGQITVIIRGSDILAQLADLESAGIVVRTGYRESIRGASYVSLQSLTPGVSFELIDSDLSLRLTTKPEASAAATKDFSTRMTQGQPQPEMGAQSDPTIVRDLRAILGFKVNDVRKAPIAVILRGDDILAPLKDLGELPLSPSIRQENIRGEQFVSLKSLSPSVIFRLDEKALELGLTIDAKESKPMVAEVKPDKRLETVRRQQSISQAAQSPADQLAILTLRVNELIKQESTVILRGDDVLVAAEDLEKAGLVSPSGEQSAIRGVNYLSLSSLANVLSFKVNDEQLSLDLTVQPVALGANVIDFKSTRPANIEYRTETSGFFNYALNLRNFDRLDSFSEAGVTVKDSLGYSSLGRTSDGSVIRGLSNWTVSHRENLNRMVLGDRLVQSDVLGGNLTLGGFGYYREFGLDPYFIRNPGLQFSGAVATPSTVDVYVNGQLIRRVSLPPGQFDLRNLPVPTGSSDTRLVLRDAFGREQEISSQQYYTSGLLKQGLHEFSYNLGARRDHLGVSSWDYSQPVLLARHRYGFTDSLSAGFRLEGSTRLGSGGPSLTMLLPIGEMELAGAASVDDGRAGGAAFLGYNYIGRSFNLGGSARFLSPRYATTSLAADDDRARLEFALSGGFSIAQRIGVTFQYLLSNWHHDERAHRFRVTTSTPLTRYIQIFFDAFYNYQTARNSIDVNTGLTFLFNDITGNLSYGNRSGTSTGIASIQRSLPVGPGYGYRFQANTSGEQYALDGLLQYQGAHGRYEAGYTRLDGQDTSLLSTSGGLAYVGGSFFATRAVQESFAVIRVPGLSGIRGYLNNLEAGATDSRGNLFVPSLLSYYGNKLSIAPKDIPLNHNVEVVDRIVAPPYRGGALVEFSAPRIQRVVGKTIVAKDGKEIVPAYGQLTLSANGKSFDSPLGKEGEFYFENLQGGRYQGLIEHKDMSCEFTLEIPQSPDELIRLGSVRCRSQ